MRQTKEKYERTIQIYEETIQSNSQDEDTWYDLGITFYNQGEYHKAIECYQNVINKNPKNIGIFYKIGLVYFELMEFQQAIEAFERVIQIYPELENVWRKISRCYIGLGDYRKAREIGSILKSLNVESTKKIENILKKMLKASCRSKMVFFMDRSGSIIWNMSKNQFCTPSNPNQLTLNITKIFDATINWGRKEDLGKYQITTLEFDDGKIFIGPAGDNGIISFITDKDVCMGMIRLIMRSGAHELKLALQSFMGAI